MSDNETPKGKAPQTGASGAAWSDKERLAYLMLLAEAGGKVEDAPVPAGRSIVSCKKMIMRLKNTCSDELDMIKAGTPITGGADGEGKKTPKKIATPKRKKADADVGVEKDGEEMVTPKKVRGRPAKKAAKEKEAETEKEEVEEEQVEDENA